MDAIAHRRLLRVVMGLPCAVMVSGYWSEMYGKALAGWNTVTYQAMTRGGRPATEWLWFNYPVPVALHDYRYLGQGFRERERIKRKKLRWVNRLRAMPILEKRALLSAIAEIAGAGDGIHSAELAMPAALDESGGAGHHRQARRTPGPRVGAGDAAGGVAGRGFIVDGQPGGGAVTDP
jgi:hypothetical protein